MSDTVHYKGKLRLVKQPGFTLEQNFSWILNNQQQDDFANFNVGESVESRIFDFACDFFGSDKVVVVDGELFLHYAHEEINDFDIFNAATHNGIDFDYEVMYYNGGMSFGGMSFDEAIAQAFKNNNIKIQEDFNYGKEN